MVTQNSQPDIPGDVSCRCWYVVGKEVANVLGQVWLALSCNHAVSLVYMWMNTTSANHLSAPPLKSLRQSDADMQQ